MFMNKMEAINDILVCTYLYIKYTVSKNVYILK